jgi:hypothetical protein
MKDILIKALFAGAIAMLAGQSAHAAGLFAGYDVDPQFRAKIMKEKAKQNQQQADTFNFANGGSSSAAQCGSQSIGNVDTAGKIGASPREVFVFAPNAINIVPTGGCK